MESPDAIFLARPEHVGEGIPLAVKDLFDTAGLITTYGSVIFSDHVPDKSAEVVLRLEAAGYANVGKTNLHEFAYGVTSMNPHFGWVPNPVAPGRIAGGSSGGSAAALAAELADAALGTDTGGSRSSSAMQFWASSERRSRTATTRSGQFARRSRFATSSTR